MKQNSVNYLNFMNFYSNFYFFSFAHETQRFIQAH